MEGRGEEEEKRKGSKKEEGTALGGCDGKVATKRSRKRRLGAENALKRPGGWGF